MKNARNIISVEQQIENEIRILKKFLDEMTLDLPASPANQNDPIRAAFNKARAHKNYHCDLKRKLGLERLLEFKKRILRGLKDRPELALI